MKLVLLAGPSGSGKSTIADSVAARLNVVVLRERALAHNAAVERGHARVRSWIAAEGIRSMLSATADATVASLAQMGPSEEWAVCDGVYDPILVARLRGAVGPENVLIVIVDAPQDVCAKRVAHRLGASLTEGRAEAAFLNSFKLAAGLGEILASADCCLTNDGALETAVDALVSFLSTAGIVASDAGH